MNPLRPLLPLLDYLYPRVCHICGVTLSGHERYLCTPCLARMPRTHYHRQPDNPMEQRFFGIFPFERATGHFFYSRGSDLASLVHDFKYHAFPGLAAYLGEVVATELLTTGFLSDIDVVIPVPMHFLKKARRGYNQTERIAGGVSKVSAIPVSHNLKAVRPHRTQTAMTLSERIENTRGIFRLDSPEEIDGKVVLLLDDVCTTGATLSAAAEAIISAAPSARISLLTLGVTF